MAIKARAQKTLTKIFDGSGVFSIIATNENTSIPISNQGLPLNYSSTPTDVYVYSGTSLLTPVTSNPEAGQFTLTASGENITAGLVTINGNHASVANASNMTTGKSSYSITLTASGKDFLGNPFSAQKKQVITPLKRGDDATSYWENVSSSVITKDVKGNMTPESTTVSAVYQSGMADPDSYDGIFKVYLKSGINFSKTPDYISSAPEQLHKITPKSDTNDIRVELYDATGTNLLDIQTVPVISQANGVISTKIVYTVTSSQVQPNDSANWADTVPTVGKGQYLWTKTTFYYTDGSNAVAYSLGSNGKDGASAALLTLVADSQIVTFDSDGATPLPASQTITLTAVLQNLTGTATFVATPYLGTAAGKPVMLGGTGNVRTLTASQFGSQYDSISVKATLGSLSDTTTIHKLTKGKPGDPGPKGADGTPGPKGADGRTQYIHIAYANSSDGNTDFSVTDPNGRVYVGVYTDFTLDDSHTPSVYTWSLIKGADGKNGSTGAPGPKGADGKTTYVHIAYANSADGSIDFSTTENSGKKYIGTLTDETEDDSTDYRKYTWSLFKGEDGADGTPGKAGADGRTSYVHIAYANSSDGTSDFSITDATEKKYVGVYTDFTAGDSLTPSVYTWSLVKGQDGRDGADGTPGPKGADGKTTYVHFAYANSSDGSRDFSTTENSGKMYIGTLTDTTVADSNDYRQYTWSLIKGEDGADGTPGPKGADGKTTYVHFAYSNSSDGKTDFSTTVYANKKFIGTLTDTTVSDSTDYSAYTWSLIKGEDGATGIQGPKGADGKTTYVHFAYANSSDGRNSFSTTDPSGRAYVGTLTDTDVSDSNEPTRYTWSLIKGPKGDDGKNGATGAPGPKGADGRTSYVHVAYANSADGNRDFSVTDPNGRAYVGVYTDFTVEDSHTTSVYTWSLIKGEDGATGIQGPKGADGKTPYFHTAWSYSADGTKGFTTTYPNLNLLLGTEQYVGDWSRWQWASAWDGDPYNGHKTVQTNNIWGGPKYVINDLFNRKVVEPNTDYTLSVKINNTSNAPMDIYFYAPAIGISDRYIIKLPPNSDWTTISTTFQFSDINPNIDHGTMRFEPSSGIPSGQGTIIQTEMKFERGNIATPYMPSASEVKTSDYPGYIGQYTDFTEADSTDHTRYTWSLIKGNDGKDGATGIQGPKGADGRTTYVHFAYSNSSDGSRDFSTTENSGKAYIGTLTDYEVPDSNDHTRYTWSLIKGADGNDGKNGVNSYSGWLTNESITLQADSNGNVPSFTSATGSFIVYNGLTQVTGLTVTQANAHGITVSLSGMDYSVTGMSADNGYVDLSVTTNGITIIKRLTVAKSKAGATGANGTSVVNSTTPPKHPAEGQWWNDLSVLPNILKVYQRGSWIPYRIDAINLVAGSIKTDNLAADVLRASNVKYTNSNGTTTNLQTFDFDGIKTLLTDTNGNTYSNIESAVGSTKIISSLQKKTNDLGQVNQLFNTEFSPDFAGWYAGNSATSGAYVKSHPLGTSDGWSMSSEKYKGSNVINFSVGNVASFYSDLIPVGASAPVSVSMSAKSSSNYNGTVTLAFYIRYYDANKNYISQNVWNSNKATSWTKFTFTDTTPTNTAYVVFNILTNGDAGTNSYSQPMLVFSESIGDYTPGQYNNNERLLKIEESSNEFKITIGEDVKKVQKSAESANTKVDNLSVGGRNYLAGTANEVSIVGANYDNQWSNGYKITLPSLGALYKEFKKTSEYFTLIFDWKYTGTNPSGQFIPQWDGGPWDIGGKYTTISNNNTSGTMTLTAIINNGWSGVSDARSVVIRYDKLPTTGTVTISNMRLMSGNMSYPWTPAPEDIEAKVDNIAVGGRNLYLNARALADGYGANGPVTVTVEPFDNTTNMWHIVSAQGHGTYVGVYLGAYANGKIPDNSDWSYSADIKGTGKVVTFGIEDSTRNPIKGNIESGWSRISQTGHVGKPINKTIIMYFDTTGSPLDVYIRLPKLETGNLTTDWTPAPEDVQAGITAAQSTADSAKTSADTANKNLEDASQSGIRYIRLRSEGNSDNSGTHFSEINVVNYSGTDVIKGKPALLVNGATNYQSANNATDGNYDSYIDLGDIRNSEKYVMFDIGSLRYDINSIRISTFTSYRTYYGVVAQTSPDGVSWSTIYRGNIKPTQLVHGIVSTTVYFGMSTTAVVDITKDNYTFGIDVNGNLLSGIAGDTQQVTLRGNAITLDGNTKVNGDFYALGGNFTNINIANVSGSNPSLIKSNFDSAYGNVSITPTNITLQSYNGTSLMTELAIGSMGISIKMPGIPSFLDSTLINANGMSFQHNGGSYATVGVMDAGFTLGNNVYGGSPMSIRIGDGVNNVANNMVFAISAAQDNGNSPQLIWAGSRVGKITTKYRTWDNPAGFIIADNIKFSTWDDSASRVEIDDTINFYNYAPIQVTGMRFQDGTTRSLHLSGKETSFRSKWFGFLNDRDQAGFGTDNTDDVMFFMKGKVYSLFEMLDRLHMR